MLRGNNILCGTSTTGTGTLTLAAGPSAVTGVDLDTWARTQIGLSSSATLLVSYTIFNCADSTYNIGTATGVEYGKGVLTLGASAGIVNCTLARSYPLEVQTLGASPAITQGSMASRVATASMLSVGTYAIVMLSVEARDVMATVPAVESTLATLGSVPRNMCLTGSGPNFSYPQSGRIIYIAVEIDKSDIIKSASVLCTTTAGTPNSIEMALYQVGSASDPARPGKKIVNFGSSTSNPWVNGSVITLTSTQAVFVPAGWYYLAVLAVYTGTSPLMRAWYSVGGGPAGVVNAGGEMRNGLGYQADGYSSLPDPAGLASVQLLTNNASYNVPFVALRNS